MIVGRHGTARLALVALVLAACGPDPGFDQNQYGLVTVTQEMREDDDFDAEVVGVFFRAERAPLPDSRDQTVACTIVPVTPPTAPTPQLEAISAGDSIMAVARGTTVRLRPAADAQRTLYGRVEDLPLPVAPGENIQIVVPGAAGGFPAASVTTVALEPPSFAMVQVPDEGAPLVLTWTPAGTAATRMRLALRYTPPGAAAEEIVCQVPDTGTFSVADALLAGWRQADPLTRTGLGSRWRSDFSVSGANVLAAYVQVESPIPFAP